MKGYTIQHSIDLLEKAVESGGTGGSSTAANVSYNNTSSGLVATNVQTALDEISGNVTTLSGNVTTLSGNVTTLSGHFDYSTSETVVGKWINNEPLYRKVISLGTLPNNRTSSVPHGITNLSQIVSIRGIASAANGSTIPLPFVDDSSKNADILLDAGTESVRVITKTDKSAFTGYAILEYTKTASETRTKKK